MRWKDLSIGKKLIIGFGSVLVLLTTISGYCYLSLSKLDHLAHESGESFEVDQFILLKTIDHLNWVSTLNDLVFKDEVTSVTLETDAHKCQFGKWLYSDRVKQLAREDKALGKLIEAIKAPHARLHQSAIKITDTYVAIDPALSDSLAHRWIDHLMWLQALNQSMLTGEAFSGVLDPKLSRFGKWLHTHRTTDPTLAKLLAGLEKPHTRLHASGQKIVSLMEGQDLAGARVLYQNETLPALEMLASQYENAMAWIDAAVEKQVAAQEIFHNETLPALDETSAVLDKIRDHYHHKSESIKAQMIMGIDNARVYGSILAVMAVVLGVLAAIFIGRGITKPIAEGVDFAKAMSAGDLTQTLVLDQKDEVGVLAAALNIMGESLRKMFQDILGGVETLTASATELSAISQQMASGAEQTSVKSNQVAAATERMSTNMTSVAAASEQASTNVQMVAAASEQMSATINEIADNTETGRSITGEAVDQAQQVSARVTELGKAALDVGKVTETINEISEQTNLLALNATIEAARAGEAGKGFAVVANEIKELAKQTAQATQDVRQKLDAIRESSDETVTDITKIGKVIADIDGIVVTIATALEEQSASTKEIASNVNQAALGIQDVNENVAQSSTVSNDIAKDVLEVNQAATEMADGSIQVNTSAGELSRLAEELSAMISRFKL
jgi:methyl-accepting chemotaxis protein